MKITNGSCLITNIPKNLKRKIVSDMLNTGKFATVEWVVKSGKTSKMTCRSGVAKHLRGGKKCTNGTSNTVAHLEQYKTVYKVNSGDKNGYRNLNLDTVMTIKAGKNVVHFAK